MVRSIQDFRAGSDRYLIARLLGTSSSAFVIRKPTARVINPIGSLLDSRRLGVDSQLDPELIGQTK